MSDSIQYKTDFSQKQSHHEGHDACIVSRNTFIHNISHEIRTPMNAIMGFSQMLKSTSLDRQQKEYMDIIMDSGHKLLEIIRNLLELSNLELGKSELELSEVDLNFFFERIWYAHSPQISRKKLHSIIDIEEGITLGRIDEVKLERALNLIIANAIKFTQAGQIELIVKRLDNESTNLDIEISDTGCGIDPKRLRYIFDMFEQGDDRLSREYAGLGLGLTIAGKLVSLMDGEISISSELGKGTSIHLLIPFEVI